MSYSWKGAPKMKFLNQNTVYVCRIFWGGGRGGRALLSIVGHGLVIHEVSRSHSTMHHSQ